MTKFTTFGIPDYWFYNGLAIVCGVVAAGHLLLGPGWTAASGWFVAAIAEYGLAVQTSRLERASRPDAPASP
jgi:hypothetical protein